MTAGYRPEIDGLRALAVIPVMLFHGGVTGFAGGFVGVDIFFVISGYLITSILLDEQQRGQFSLAGFYERRARRILPALFLVMACTIPFAWLWMPDRQLGEYGQSLMATSLFVSNFHFWSESGYFGSAAEEKPLLHTWSLAIEEQFYLLFPLLLALVWWFQKRWLVPVTVLLVIVSLAFAMLPLSVERETLFYLIPSRAWELLAGAVLAMILLNTNRKDTPANGLFAAFGVFLVVLSMVLIDRSTEFPGPATILPVLGTALIIAFAGNMNWVGRLLGAPVLAGIGLISYSAYLWHQPLFAFARLRSLNAPPELAMSGLVIVALILAYMSWRFVEKPFRDRRWLSRSQVFGVSVVAGAILIGAGATIGSAELTGGRLTKEQQLMVSPAHSKGEDCDWMPLSDEFDELVGCWMGVKDAPNPVILWGDSHAEALLDVLGDEFKSRNLGGLYVRNHACRNVPGTYTEDKNKPSRVKRCEDSQNALLEKLRSMRPRGVIVALRWTLRVYPVSGAGETVGFDNGEGGREDMGVRAYVARNAEGNYVKGDEAKFVAVREFLAGLKSVGAPVVVIYPVPEVGWHIGNLNFKHIVANGQTPAEISTDYKLYLARNSFILGALDKLVPELGLRAIDPAGMLCNTVRPGRCMAQENGVPLYSDDDHVSATGARMLVSKLLPEIGIGP